jgi:transposase-like protein
VARWGQFTKEFKARVVERMRECANIKALAAELQISRQALYRWKEEIEGKAVQKRSSPCVSPGLAELRKEIADLKIALADKTMEASFFRGALQRVEARRRSRKDSGGPESTTRLRK